MSVKLTIEQGDIKKAAREFSEKEFPRFASECDLHETFPFDLWKKACSLGFVGMHIIEDFGGASAGTLECGIVMEEFWRIDPGCGGILLTTLGSELLQLFGSDDQKRDLLPPLTIGKEIMALAWLDSYRGEVTATKIHQDGKAYKIVGKKVSVINGALATHILVVCQTNFRDVVAVVLDKDQDGMEVNTILGKFGMRATNLAEIAFNGTRVEEKNIIRGEAIFWETDERIALYKALQCVGTAQGALDQAVHYIRKRTQFGRPIGWFQGIRHRVSELATAVEAARSLCYSACNNFDSGERDDKFVRMASLFAGETASRVTGQALQLHGGYGFTKDMEIEKFYRDAHTLEIWLGRKDIDKALIGDRIIGKL